MTDYQLSHLDLSTRMELAFMMLNPERPWGQVSDLSREHGVSRKFLYELQEKARKGLAEALQPQAAGRRSNHRQLIIDAAFVQRAIAACMSIVPGTVRTVQALLDLLCGVQRSVGYISQSAQELGAAALAYQQGLSLPILALAEADEIFQDRKPCLTLVDGRSFLVLSLSVQTHRDETTWGSVLLDVQKQGVHLVDVASDGAKGIHQAGVKAVSLLIPLRPDLFHLIREAHHTTQRLEKAAYRAIGNAERARRAQEEQVLPKRRRGAPLKVKVALPQALAEEQQTIAHLEAWEWLFHEIRQALEPIDPLGCIVSARQARQTLTTALELLQTLENQTIQTFVSQFYEKLDELIAPLDWLEQALAPWREGLDPQLEAWITWAWQHQQELNLTIDQLLPASHLDLVTAFWNASRCSIALSAWPNPCTVGCVLTCRSIAACRNGYCLCFN